MRQERFERGSFSPCLEAAILLVLLCLLLQPLTAGVARSQEIEPPATIDPAVSCATGTCHAAVGDQPHLHWSNLTEPGECQQCHVPDGELHEFETEDSKTACLKCHEGIAEMIAGARSVHEPAEKACSDCHDPHGGQVKGMLKDVDDEDLAPLCFSCHESGIVNDDFGHGPAVQGACGTCHDSHASIHQKLLVVDGAQLCEGCHDELAANIADAELVHDPAYDDCIDCHDPHSSPHPGLLYAESRQMCAECHEEIVEIAEESAVDHAATTSGDECLNCHSPHWSNHSGLKQPEQELCLGCHDQAVRSGDAVLIDMAEHLSEYKEWHEPVAENDCSSCHDPHGAENFRLLTKRYPEKFYASFDLENYGLCFSCHEETLATVEPTRKATRFRDGDRNLHYLHLNQKGRGRTCRACHDVHASENSLQIRDEVRFGRWLMPLNFEKSDVGGSCLPGCHSLKTYTREPGTEAVGK